MFHPPTILSSTGEPPTDPHPPQSRSLPTATTHLTRQTPSSTAHHQASSIHHHATTSSSLSVQQEPDSGYEASPSSVTDTARSTFRFEDEPDDPDDPGSDLEDEFEHLTDSMLLDSAEEWDCCRECGSSCSCHCRTDSATVAEDTSNCDNASEGSSSCLTAADQRPSSLPITIPNRASGPSGDSDDHCHRRTVSSPPSDRRAGQPLSWPLCALVRLGLAGGAVVPRFLSHLSPRAEGLMQRLAEPQRLRRRHANSDEDVSSSSDSEGPEDVFNLSQEAPRPSPASPAAIGGSAPSGSRLQPLPDVVQSSSGGGRRGRSVSVNLPPEPEMLRSIGRSLIRLSDQFQRGREFCNGYACMRRRTASDIYHLKRSS